MTLGACETHVGGVYPKISLIFVLVTYLPTNASEIRRCISIFTESESIIELILKSAFIASSIYLSWWLYDAKIPAKLLSGI